MGSKNRNKPSKSGISLVKKKNIKGGKMSSGKKTKTKSVVLARRKLQAVVRKKAHQKKYGTSKPAEVDVNMEDVLDMIDDDELAHLKGDQFKNRQNLVISKASKLNSQKENKRGKRKNDVEDDDVERQYEKKLEDFDGVNKKIKFLLPVKTNRGLQEQTVEEGDESEEEEEQTKEHQTNDNGDAAKKPSIKDTVLSLGSLYAQRQKTYDHYKLRIATLSSGFLEDPQNKMKNLEALLMIMESCDDAVYCSVPQLTALSLLYVFKDVLPSYAIKNNNPDGVKLKKETLSLQNFEAALLSKYKHYLKNLEKFLTMYCPKKKSQAVNREEKVFGKTAIRCLGEMLLSHPYFNLAVNIVNLLVPYLNNWDPELREIVFDYIKKLFKIDKRGELSYEIVRRINNLLKDKSVQKGKRVIYHEVLNVLLNLRIKKADLEREKVEETTSTKKMSFEQRKKLSKSQRKKAKELVLLEKELLEASAEENKERKSHYLTEITKLLFTIYFRAIKMEGNSKILSSVLEGLSEFAHVINIDFFDDLLKVLEGLLRDGQLKQYQRLFCISTVLTVLDGQGAILNLDPTAFHKHLYATLINLRVGDVETGVGLALKCVRLATGANMPGPRAIAFAKRLATVALQVEHHDAAGILMQLKDVMRLHPQVAGLLDCEGSVASGIYLPELEDPDHCCANSSTMWELTALMNHYNPYVAQIAQNFVTPTNKQVWNSKVKMSPEMMCAGLDPRNPHIDRYSELFYPALPEREQIVSKRRSGNFQFRPRTDYYRDEVDWKEYLKDDDDMEEINFLESMNC